MILGKPWGSNITRVLYTVDIGIVTLNVCSWCISKLGGSPERETLKIPPRCGSSASAVNGAKSQSHEQHDTGSERSPMKTMHLPSSCRTNKLVRCLPYAQRGLVLFVKTGRMRRCHLTGRRYCGGNYIPNLWKKQRKISFSCTNLSSNLPFKSLSGTCRGALKNGL